jgi:hypothetical protein
MFVLLLVGQSAAVTANIRLDGSTRKEPLPVSDEYIFVPIPECWSARLSWRRKIQSARTGSKVIPEYQKLYIEFIDAGPLAAD